MDALSIKKKTLHGDSVWALHSPTGTLGTVYSADRAGMIARTESPGHLGMDDGLSVALAKEHTGVHSLAAAGGMVWAATASSSINGWADLDLGVDADYDGAAWPARLASVVSQPSLSSYRQPSVVSIGETKIPRDCFLRTSNSVSKGRDWDGATMHSMRKPSEAGVDEDEEEGDVVVPYHSLPEETIQGHNGLIKHIMLNDRKRVLTLDTAGEVVLWDLLKVCLPLTTG